MNVPLAVAGLILVGITAGLLIFFSLPRRKRRRSLRAIPALQALRRSIGLTVEQGTRLHVSLGSTSITQPAGASALVGLSSLERIATISSISDRPPVASSGDGSLALLSKGTIRAAYRINNALDQYDADRGQLTGISPLSYAAGAIPLMTDEHVTSNVLLGHFGPEVALLTMTADQNNQFSVGGSNSLQGQAVLFATAQEALIGEEVFAVPAYLQAGRIYEASLLTQDILRWVLIGGLILGSILSLLGIL